MHDRRGDQGGSPASNADGRRTLWHARAPACGGTMPTRTAPPPERRRAARRCPGPPRRLGARLGEADQRGGYTALHLAADAGQADAVAALCALGAELDAPSTKGLTPLALALMKVRAHALGRPPAELSVLGAERCCPARRACSPAQHSTAACDATACERALIAKRKPLGILAVPR